MKGQLTLVSLLLLAMMLASCEQIAPPAVPTPIPSSTPQPATNTPEAPTSTPVPTVPPSPTPIPPKILRIGHLRFPSTLDPHRASSRDEVEVLRFIYEGLVGIDEKGNLIPGAADRWEFSQQGSQVTFHIREGLKRSDGTTVTAKDYEYALSRAMDPRVPDRYFSYLVYDVKGAVNLDGIDPKNAKPGVLDKAIADYGVKATDNSTLTITFDNPSAFWSSVASTWLTYPVDYWQVTRDADKWWTQPQGHVGNGPFKIKSIEQGKKIVLERNENYWRGKTSLDQVELIYFPDGKSLSDAYRKGQVDIASGLALEQVKTSEAKQDEVLRTPRPWTAMFAFNINKKPFTDINVRRAFSAAFDREGFVRDILEGVGKPYTRWMPPGIPGANIDEPGVPAYDPRLAVRYLVDNGYAAKDSSATSPKVDCAKLGEIRLTFPSTSSAQQRMQYLAGNLMSAFKCPVILDPIDPTAYDMLIRDAKNVPQLSYTGWYGDYAHPQNWLSLYWKCGGVAARFGYCNKNLDALLQGAERQLDYQESLKAYREAETLLLKDVPSIFSHYSMNVFLLKPYVVGPKEHAGGNDLQFPGEWGPVWEYDIDFATVPQDQGKQ